MKLAAIAVLALLCLSAQAQEPTFTVTLHWTAPTMNTDGGPLTDLAGYKIYWSEGSGGTLGEPLDVANPGVLSRVLTDAELDDDTLYCFRATAYDDSDLESDLSGEACTTTPDLTVPGAPTNLTVEIVFGVQ